MPDFRIIGQAPVQGPDIGASYDRGLGNANPSTLGNIFEGVTEGLDFGTKLSARIEQTDALAKETARLNDPERLARQAVKEQLDNKVLSQDLLTKSIENQLDILYGENDRIFSSEKARLDNLKIQEEYDLSRAYGREDRELNQKLKKAQIYDLYNRDSDNADGSSDKAAALRFRKMQEIRQLEKQLEGIQPTTAGQVDPFSGEEIRAKISEEDQQLVDSIKSRRDQLQAEVNADLNSPTARYDRATTEFSSGAERATLNDRTTRTEVLNDSFAKAEQAVGATRSTYSTPTESVISWASTLNEINSQLKGVNNPEQRTAAQARLVQQFKDVGPDYIEQTAAQLKGQEKKNFEQIVNTARALSGDQELLSPPQKRAQAIGLTPEYVESPTKAQQDLNIMLNVGPEFVENDEFRKALQTDPIIVGAQAALREAKTFKPVIVPYDAKTDDLDVADRQQSTMVVKFLKPDGTFASVQAPAPAPGDARGQAILSMVQDFSVQQAPQVTAQQQATMQGQQLVQQNQAVQQDVRAANPPPGVVPQQQQAPVGAGPAATPTPTPAPQPTATPRPTVEKTTIDGIDYTIDRDTRLAIPEQAVTDSVLQGRITADIQSRIGKVDQKDINVAMNRLNKRVEVLRKENKNSQEGISSRQEVLRAMERLADQLVANDNTWIMSRRGTVPEFVDKMQEISGVFGSEDSKKVMQNRAAITQAQGAILTSFLGKEGRSTTVNSPTEQQTVIGTILNNNTDFQTFKNWIQQEKANIQREVDITDFRNAAAKDPFYNDPETVNQFLNEYTQSPFSQPLKLNPEKYAEQDGKISLVPGAQDLPDYVANTNNPRGEIYLTPLQYMELKGKIKDYDKNPANNSPAAPKPTTTPTAPRPEQRSALDAIGDFFVPNANAQEADVAPPGGGADFLAEQGVQGSPQPQEGMSVTAIPVAWDNQTTQGREPVPGTGGNVPPRPKRGIWGAIMESGQDAPMGSTADLGELPTGTQDVLTSSNPAKTLLAKRGIKLKPTEEAAYNGLVAAIKADYDSLQGGLTPTPGGMVRTNRLKFYLENYLPNAVAFDSLEELSIAQGKALRNLGVIPKETTDRELELKAMAYAQAREDFGEGEFATSAILRATDAAGFLIQNLGLGKVLGTGLKAVTGAKELGRVAQFGTNVVTDVLQNAALENDPSKVNTWEELLTSARNTAALSGGSQLVLGAFLKQIPAIYKAVKGSESASETFAGLASGRFGITREEFEDVLAWSARTGRDPRERLPESAYALLDELVSNPIARPYVTRWAAERAANTANRIAQVTDDAGFDQLPGVRALQANFRNDMQKAVAGIKDTAQRVADSNRAIAVEQATKDLSDRTSQVVGKLTTEGIEEGEQVIKQLDELFTTQNARLESPLGATGNLIDDIGTNARVLEAQSKYLNDTLNVAYGNLDDVYIPEDLFEKFVTELQTNPEMPLGRSVIEKTAMGFKKGGPLTESGVTELSNQAQALIEMRSDLMKQLYLQEMGMKTPQANLMIAEIDRTLKKAFKETGFDLPDDVFKKFMNIQSEGRAVRDKMLARKDILQQIEVNIGKGAGDTPSAVKDSVFTRINLDKLNDVFGVEGAKQLKQQLNSVDEIVNLLKDYKKTGAFKPEALNAVAKRANTYGNTRFFMEKLMKESDILPDELAALANKGERTAFGDAALQYLKETVDKTASDTANTLVDTADVSKLIGLTPSEVTKLKTFMTKEQQDVVDTFIEGYQGAQRAGRLADAPVSAQAPRSNYPTTMSRRIIQTNFTALLDVISSVQKGVVRAKQVNQLAEAALDPNPDKFVKLLEETASKMKPTAKTGLVNNKAYSGLMEGSTASEAARQFTQIINNYKGKQEVWDKRRERLVNQFRSQDPTNEAQMQSLKNNTPEAAFEAYIQQRQKRPEPPSMDDVFETYMRKRRVQ